MQSIKLHCGICTIKNVYKILYCSHSLYFPYTHEAEKNERFIYMSNHKFIHTHTNIYTHMCSMCTYNSNGSEQICTKTHYWQWLSVGSVVMLTCIFQIFYHQFLWFLWRKQLMFRIWPVLPFSLVMLFKSGS